MSGGDTTMSNQNHKARDVRGKVRFNAKQQALIVKTGVKAGRTKPLLRPFDAAHRDDPI